MTDRTHRLKAVSAAAEPQRNDDRDSDESRVRAERLAAELPHQLTLF